MKRVSSQVIALGLITALGLVTAGSLQAAETPNQGIQYRGPAQNWHSLQAAPWLRHQAPAGAILPFLGYQTD